MKISFLIEKPDEVSSVVYRISQLFLNPEFKRCLVILDTQEIELPLPKDTKKTKKEKPKKFNKNYS